MSGINKSSMQVVVIFGSNSGNKLHIIEEAIAILAAKTGTITITSSFYETEPWGFDTPEQFLNKIVVYNTTLSPHDFLRECLSTEKQLGRIRKPGTQRYTSRPIDIDILFFGDLIINTQELIIPHPRLTERKFVLIPLNEIMPAYRHPAFQQSVSELLAYCQDELNVLKITYTEK